MKQTCKFCKSEIDAECYKCPMCREWLHPYRLRKDNPLIKRYVGLMVLFLIVFYAPRYFLVKKIEDSFKPIVFKTFKTAADHKLEIIWHKPSGKIPNKVLGELINKGSETFSSLTPTVYFYDAKKELIKIETGHIWATIKPGHKKLFQVDYVCNCGKDENIPKTFTSYELAIEDGHIEN